MLVNSKAYAYHCAEQYMPNRTYYQKEREALKYKFDNNDLQQESN